MLKESETLELKRSTSEMKEALVSICSMLNKHHHGELYFGVGNDGAAFGQQLNEKTLRDVSKSIADGIEPKIFPAVSKVIIDGKECIHVSFSGTSQPYYANGRAYIRVGDEDRRLSAKEIENMILKKNKDKMRWDTEVSSRDINEANENLLKDYISKANSSGRIGFTFDEKTNILKKLNLVADDKMFRAAEVLFCDNNMLEVQAAVFAGTDKVTFLDIRQLKGNMFYLLEKSEEYIKEHMDWRVEIERMERDEIPEIPLKALREALVNSFCHRDYYAPESNKIAIFKDRVEIYNPGSFPDGLMPEDFIKGFESSVLRNPLIAEILYRSNDIEKWGSGLKRIYDECKAKNVEVKFKVLKYGFLAVFYRAKDFGGRFGGRLGVVLGATLKREKMMMEMIRQNPKIAKKTIASEMGIKLGIVKRMLQNMRNKDLIAWKGSSRSGEWEVADEAGKDDEFNEDAPVNVTNGTKNDVVNDTENALKTVEKSALKTPKIALKNQKIALKTAQKILEQIRNNPCITIPELVTKIGIRERAIKYSLAKLKRKGLIRRIGPDRGGHWETLN